MNKRTAKWIGAFIGAIVVVLLLRSFFIASCVAPSKGVESSLYEGERIIVNKWSYGLRLPLMNWFGYHRWNENLVHRHDVILFNNPSNYTTSAIDERELFISRCVGIPNDTLYVDSLFAIHPKSTKSYPLVIPAKRSVIRVYPWNMTLLRNTLVLHEGKNAVIKHDTLFVDGKPTQHCFFTKNYYWTASRTSVPLSDSQLFGFVPEDHIIGKAWFIWFSKTPNTGIANGYRWPRFFNRIY